MGAFANRMKALGTKLLKPGRFGKELAAFKHYTSSGQSPSALTVTRTSTTYYCYVAPLDFSLKELDSGVVTQGNKKLYIEANGNVPRMGDTVTLGSVEYRLIKQLDLLETQNTDCLYIWEIGV